VVTSVTLATLIRVLAIDDIVSGTVLTFSRIAVTCFV